MQKNVNTIAINESGTHSYIGAIPDRLRRSTTGRIEEISKHVKRQEIKICLWLMRNEQKALTTNPKQIPKQKQIGRTVEAIKRTPLSEEPSLKGSEFPKRIAQQKANIVPGSIPPATDVVRYETV